MHSALASLHSGIRRLTSAVSRNVDSKLSNVSPEESLRFERLAMQAILLVACRGLSLVGPEFENSSLPLRGALISAALVGPKRGEPTHALGAHVLDSETSVLMGRCGEGIVAFARRPCRHSPLPLAIVDRILEVARYVLVCSGAPCAWYRYLRPPEAFATYRRANFVFDVCHILCNPAPGLGLPTLFRIVLSGLVRC